MVKEETVVMEKRGEIGTLTFNLPEVFNAYSRAVSDELIQGLEAFTNDPAVRVIVINGAGKGFMAGVDINMVNGWTAQGNAGKYVKPWGKCLAPICLKSGPSPSSLRSTVLLLVWDVRLPWVVIIVLWRKRRNLHT